MKNKVLIGVVVAIVLVAGYLINAYNNFTGLNVQIDTQWAQVEAQYQRRFDLIPNLVNLTEGALQQEKEVFGNIADARTRYAGAKSIDEKAQAATQLEGSLARLLVVMENYPQLKSLDSIESMKVQLEGTENRVSVERIRFNDFVGQYNIATKRFPGNLLAKMFGFEARSFFEAASGSEVAPVIDITK